MIALSIFVAVQIPIVISLSPSATFPVYGLAQKVTIDTSADGHEGRFFGEGILQAVVSVPDLGNHNEVDNLTVHITAYSDSGSSTEKSFQIPETNAGSSMFEFFLMQADANSVNPDDIDPINSDGVEGSVGSGIHAAPIFTFGPDSSMADIPIDSNLYEDAKFDLMAKDVKTSVSYEQSFARLELDRDSYGSNNIVHVSVEDQDANLDPTVRDSFEVDPISAPNKDLLNLEGGSIIEAVAFRETGDNTGVFEGEYRLGTAIQVDADSLTFAVFDKANYGSDLDSPENNSNLSDEISFNVGNTNGRVTLSNTTEGGTNQTINSTQNNETGLVTKAITISAPNLRDENGIVGFHASKRASATLSTSLMNNNKQEQPFLVIIEVRDADDVTIFLDLVNGSLDPNGQKVAETHWIPNTEGDFQVRIFVVSALVDGELLSSLSASNVIVG